MKDEGKVLNLEGVWICILNLQ